MVKSLAPKFDKFSFKTCLSQSIKFFLNRVLRFWPTFVAVSIFCYVLGDFHADRFDKPLFDSVFFFPIKKQVPIAFAGKLTLSTKSIHTNE